MNETRTLLSKRGPARRVTGVEAAARLAVLMLGVLLAFSGCADPRNPPTQPRDPGYTETIVLWQDAVSAGNPLAASFTVANTLAAINLPGVEHPARLTIAAYVEPDADIVRYEEIVNDSVPAVSRVIVGYQSVLDALLAATDSLNRIDTTFRNHCNPCLACPCTTNCAFDTCGSAARYAEIAALTTIYQDSAAPYIAYRDALNAEAQAIGIVVDNRYRLALRFDDPAGEPVYPEAVFATADTLTGQEIYLAQTDTTTGLKGRGFTLNMESFYAADPSPANVGFDYEVNWTTCFREDRPCLRPGSHTLYATLTGGSTTRITGTIVLVYEGERP